MLWQINRPLAAGRAIEGFMHKPVRKAVFPVAGLGTRFLPATKSMPKEMLPIVDKPLIHYAVEEAKAAGIEQFILVTGRGKAAMEDHFDYPYELASTLKERGKTAALGLGHAVLCAKEIVGDEPFAVMLPDDLVLAKTPCLKQMVDVFAETQGNVVAVMDVPREHTNRYGVLDIAADEGKLVRVKGLVEKPAPEKAPSTLSIIGRYILRPEIFGHLEKTERGAGGEIQLTDGMLKLLDGKS